MRSMRRFSGKIDPALRRRAVALTRPDRQGKKALPDYIGKPGTVIISDSHGEIRTYLNTYETLPGFHTRLY